MVARFGADRFGADQPAPDHHDLPLPGPPADWEVAHPLPRALMQPPGQHAAVRAAVLDLNPLDEHLPTSVGNVDRLDETVSEQVAQHARRVPRPPVAWLTARGPRLDSCVAGPCRYRSARRAKAIGICPSCFIRRKG